MKKSLFIGSRDKSTKIRWPEIILLEKQQKHLKLVTESKTFEIDASFRELIKKLPKKFVRVHKNYLVPMDRIMGFDRAGGSLFVLPFKPDDDIALPETWIRIPLGKKFDRFLRSGQLIQGREKQYKKKINRLLLELLTGENNN